MDVIGLYSILLGGLLALYPARLLTSRLLRCVWPHLRAPFARFLLYRLLTPQWPSIGVTWLELLVFLSFLAANAYPLVMCAVRGGSLGVLGNTAAMMAVMNATPLFLGGRTNPLVDRIGIARHTYYLAHHWIGRVVVVEGLLHAGLALADRTAAFSVKTSGYVAAGGLLAICVTSLAFSRTYLRTLFPKIHAVLFLAVLAATLSHVIFVGRTIPQIPVYVAAGLWTLTALYRLLRLSFAAGRATVYDKWEDSQVTRIGLRSGRLCVFPGSYFYVHLPRKATAFSPESALHYEVLTSYPMAVMRYTQAPSSDETSLAFLVSHQARSLRGLAFRLGQRLLLEGPYGRDLSLHLFDRVILTAKGMGIAGVLPHAFGLAEHKQHDDEVKARIFAKAYSTKAAKRASADSSSSGMATRHESPGPSAGSDAGSTIANETQGRSPQQQDTIKSLFRDLTHRVDLFWVLEHNSQEKWIDGYLRALQTLDPNNRLLLVWCIYPSPRTGPPPFTESRYWRAVYPKEGQLWSGTSRAMREVAYESLSPGKTVVVVCGDSEYRATTRRTVTSLVTADRDLSFAEVEYRPGATARDADSAMLAEEGALQHPWPDGKAKQKGS